MPQAEGGHGLAPVDGFPAVVDDPLLHQFDHSVAQQFRVHPQVVLIAQVGEDRVGQGPVPDLNGVAVQDDAGDVLADLLGHIVRSDGFVFQEGLIMADDVIHVLNVNEPVSVHPGHVAVHLGDDQMGLLYRCLDDVHADPQAHVAVLVRRGSLDQGHLDGDHSPAEQFRHIGQKERSVVGHPPVDRFP